MHLVQVEVVGLEPRERTLQLLAGAVLVAHLRLAGQEDLAAVEALQGRSHLDLGVAIGRGHIEVVDALLERLVNSGRGLLLVQLGQGQTREGNNRDLRPGPPQDASRQPGHLVLPARVAPCPARSVPLTQRTTAGRRTRHFEEFSSFHDDPLHTRMTQARLRNASMAPINASAIVKSRRDSDNHYGAFAFPFGHVAAVRCSAPRSLPRRANQSVPSAPKAKAVSRFRAGLCCQRNAPPKAATETIMSRMR